MTWSEAYDFVKKVYNTLVFQRGWTIEQIDKTDADFLFEIIGYKEEKEVYLSDVW